MVHRKIYPSLYPTLQPAGSPRSPRRSTRSSTHQIYSTIAPIHAISMIFGVAACKLDPPVTNFSKLLPSMAWRLLNILAIIYSLNLAVKRIEKLNNYGVVKTRITIGYLMFGTNVTLSLSLMILSILGRIDFLRSIQALDTIDERLAKQFDIEINYRRFRNRQLIHLMTILSIIVILAIRSWFYINPLTSPYGFTYFIAIQTSTLKILVSFQFINLLHHLRDRFAALNDQLVIVCLRIETNRIDRNSITECIEVYQKLRNVAEVHQILVDISKIVNRAFGTQILFSLTASFVIITCELYHATIYIPEEWNVAFMNINWSIVYAIEMICIVAACNSVICKMQKTVVLMHRISLKCLHIYTHAIVDSFFLREPHQKFEFTAFGFFVIDSRLLQSVIVAVTTYLVILVQFDTSLATKRDQILAIANVTIPSNNIV